MNYGKPCSRPSLPGEGQEEGNAHLPGIDKIREGLQQRAMILYAMADNEKRKSLRRTRAFAFQPDFRNFFTDVFFNGNAGALTRHAGLILKKLQIFFYRTPWT